MEFVNTKNLISKYFDDELLSNIVVKVGKGEEVYFETFRSRDMQLKATTMFDMASVTKIMVTTTLALMAIDDKLFSFDSYVSDFFDTPKHFENLKISHLLTHTIGFGNKDLRKENNNYDNIAEYILNLKGNEIGEEVEYSCPAFILLGKIIEKVYGKRLDVLFQQKIATPLNLKNSCFNPVEKGYSDFVNSNLRAQELGIVNDNNCRFLGGVAGNAGLFSCISDVSAYLKMLLCNGVPLIKKDTLDYALKNYTADKSASRGMGFLCSDERYSQTATLFNENSFGHCGHTGQSVFFNKESKLYVIVLSDATISTIKKDDGEYGVVIKFREEIHKAIKEDLLKGDLI